MTKPKRYPRARSALHARFLNSQGVEVRKPFHNEWIGPATPSGLIALLRFRYAFDEETTARVLGLLSRAADGTAIKYGSRISIIPAGHGRVMLQLALASPPKLKVRPLSLKGEEI